MDKFPALNSVPRASAISSALLTYEPYYGLREKPFGLATDPKFLYKSSAHAGTFEDLLLAIRRREGLIVLAGDIGTGKTTLCKAVLERLDRKTFTTFVPDPFVTRDDLLKMLLLDFGVMSVDDLKGGRLAGALYADLSYPFYDFLKSLVPLQAFAVLIIDEAQNLLPHSSRKFASFRISESPEKLLRGCTCWPARAAGQAQAAGDAAAARSARVCSMSPSAAQPGTGLRDTSRTV